MERESTGTAEDVDLLHQNWVIPGLKWLRMIGKCFGSLPSLRQRRAVSKSLPARKNKPLVVMGCDGFWGLVHSTSMIRSTARKTPDALWKESQGPSAPRPFNLL